MKKILTLLTGLSLTTTAVNTIISCTIKSNPEQADGGGLDYQGDLKILNTITKHIADSFQQYATEKTLIDINDYSIPEF
ncbi:MULTISPECIES: lipoprotein [unclassified Spiroplasma]|uniref:lipoprotein n=1 Tax=unclassified Spiroplasma TaxID=2637901 RepID=UPI0030D5BC72